MKRFYILLAIVLTLGLLPLAAAAQEPSPEGPRRDAETVIGLYEGDPAAHFAPAGVAPEGLTLPAPAAPLADPPAHTRLVYESYANDNWDIYAVNADASVLSRITSSASAEAAPSSKYGALEVLFISDLDGDLDIYHAPASGDPWQNLTNDSANDYSPSWSPDETRIAFYSYRSGNADIYVMDNDGSNLVQLTSAPEYDGYPSWSPDGSQLVFASRRSGSYDLWVMNADGSNPHQLTSGIYAIHPNWSPVGDKIAFSGDGNGDGWLEIWQVAPDGSGLQKLYGAESDATDVWGPVWSPDGEWFSYSQTNWIYYQGQWYWTGSRLYLRHPATGSTHQPTGDTRVWRADWVLRDQDPPEACSLVSSALQRSNPAYLRAWAEDALSGVAAYDLQVRADASAPWQQVLTASATPSYLYGAAHLSHYEARCRATDWEGNQASWDSAPVAEISVDTVWPWSAAQVSQNLAYQQALVRWSGSDSGSGIASYDIFVRDQAGGDWAAWLTGTTATSASYSGTAGHSYDFRAQAHDLAGHTQPWVPEAQTSVTFYVAELSGLVTDNRGFVGIPPTITADPAPMHSEIEPGGPYRLYLETDGNYQVSASAPGYAGLPAAGLNIIGQQRLDWVLPPLEDAVQNGGFESGLADWGTAGDVQPAPSAVHTGAAGAQLTGAAAFSQTVWVDPAWNAPTLSLRYWLPGDLPTGTFTVELSASLSPSGTLTSTVLTVTQATDGWMHAWADLSSYSGLTATLTAGLDSGQALVDEISLGPWETPVVSAASPNTWEGGGSALLTIQGQNFVDGCQAWLGETQLTDVTWISSTQITAQAPASLPGGPLDLTVANPSGAAFTLPGAVQVNGLRTLLPIVLRRTAEAVPSAWPTLGYDPGHSGYQPNDPGASRYALAWQAAIAGNGSLTQVSVADGVLVANNSYDAGNLIVYGFDAATGQALWDYHSTRTRVTPATLAYGAAYFQQTSGGDDSYLSCLDLYDGEPCWHAAFESQSSSYYAPVVVEQTAYVPGGMEGGMYSFDLHTGERNWFVKLAHTLDPWGMTYADGVLYTCLSGQFRALDPLTGGIIWGLDLPADQYSAATPVISGRRAVVRMVAPGYNITLTVIDLDTHSVAWSISNFGPMPAVVDGVIYTLNNGELTALDLADGSLLWSFYGDGQLTATPIVTAEYIYVASADNTYVLDRDSHNSVWSFDHGGILAVANGYLYVASPERQIYALRAQQP